MKKKLEQLASSLLSANTVSCAYDQVIWLPVGIRRGPASMLYFSFVVVVGSLYYKHHYCAACEPLNSSFLLVVQMLDLIKKLSAPLFHIVFFWAAWWESGLHSCLTVRRFWVRSLDRTNGLFVYSCIRFLVVLQFSLFHKKHVSGQTQLSLATADLNGS